MRRLTALWPLALSLACVACGGSSATTPASHSTSTSAPAPPGSGAVLFAHNCSACHSLIGNESLRKQGGDLLGYRMSRAQLLGFTQVMPTRRLSTAELNAVVSYILHAQARAGGS